MKSSNIKLLWILISITLFVLAVVGTVILILAKTPFAPENRPSSEEVNEQRTAALDPIPKPDSNAATILTPKESWNTATSASDSSQPPESISSLPSDKEISSTPEANLAEPNQENKVENTSTKAERLPAPQKTQESRFVEENQRNQSRIISGNRPKTEQPISTVPVSPPPVKPKKPSSPKQKPQRVTPSKEKKETVVKYWIQVASYTVLSSAEKTKEDLKKKGFEAIISTKNIKGTTHYRLRIGPFDSKEEAESYLKKIDSKRYGGAYISKTTSHPIEP